MEDVFKEALRDYKMASKIELNQMIMDGYEEIDQDGDKYGAQWSGGGFYQHFQDGL